MIIDNTTREQSARKLVIFCLRNLQIVSTNLTFNFII